MGKQKYINYKDNEYLLTDDNWKTIRATNDQTIPSGYTHDTNINHIFEANIRFHYGVRPGNYLIKELKKIGKIREAISGVPINKKEGYGDEFEVFCINVLHGVTYEEAVEKYVVIGSGDGGVDAIYYEKDKKECTVYQMKLSELKDSNLPRMKTSIDLYVQGKLNQQADSSDLKAFLDKNIPDISTYSIKYKTISENGRLNTNILTSTVFNRFFDNKVLLSPEHRTLQIRLESSVNDKKTYASLPNDEIIFVFVNAKKFIEDLVSCYGDNMESAFVNNVRGYVGDDDDMKYTITREPKKFCSYNNGISITGKCKIENEDASYFVKVEDTCVVNGQQTIYNLYNCQKTGTHIDRITLPVFIKNTTNQKDQSKIARYNNTQKSVTQLDLLSINERVRKIQKQLIDKLDKHDNNIYYLNVVSTGEKGVVKYAKSIYGRNNIVKLSDFVKLFSVVRDPTKLGEWKNNLNDQIKDAYNSEGKEFPECSLEEARKICSCIVRSKPILAENRSEYAIADLAIQYLLYLGLDENKTKEVIEKTTAKNIGSVKKKADIYKSKTAFSKVMYFVPKKYQPVI